MAHAPTYPQRLNALPGADRTLLKGMTAVALLALFIGVLAGVATALVRGGLLSVPMADGYRFLTIHGVGIFFYWLFTAQTALLLGLAACEHGKGLAWRPLAWAAFGLMLLGLGLSMAGSVSGTPLLYNGSPELVRDNPRDLLLFNAGRAAGSRGVGIQDRLVDGRLVQLHQADVCCEVSELCRRRPPRTESCEERRATVVQTQGGRNVGGRICTVPEGRLPSSDCRTEDRTDDWETF